MPLMTLGIPAAASVRRIKRRPQTQLHRERGHGAAPRSQPAEQNADAGAAGDRPRLFNRRSRSIVRRTSSLAKAAAPRARR